MDSMWPMLSSALPIWRSKTFLVSNSSGETKTVLYGGDSFSNSILYYIIPTQVHPLESHRRKAVLINGAVYRTAPWG